MRVARECASEGAAETTTAPWRTRGSPPNIASQSTDPALGATGAASSATAGDRSRLACADTDATRRRRATAGGCGPAPDANPSRRTTRRAGVARVARLARVRFARASARPMDERWQEFGYSTRARRARAQRWFRSRASCASRQGAATAIYVPPPRPPKAPPPAEPRRPRMFKVVDIRSREVLAEDATARATIQVLNGVRSIVDVNVYVWTPATETWRLLTFDEQRLLWSHRDPAPTTAPDGGAPARSLGWERASARGPGRAAAATRLQAPGRSRLCAWTSRR